jgi:hypothetical protein
VVVLPPGIPGHPPPEIPGGLRLPFPPFLYIEGVILKGHAEGAPGAGKDLGRIEPRLQPPPEIPHPRLIPAVKPPHQGLPMLHGAKLGHPGAVETGLQGPGLEESGGGAGVHGG